MFMNKRARRLTRDRPHGGGNDAGAGASICCMKAGTPKLWCSHHIGIHLRRAVEGARCISFEEINHFGRSHILVFYMDSFDNSFSRGAMPAACIGEVKDDM